MNVLGRDVAHVSRREILAAGFAFAAMVAVSGSFGRSAIAAPSASGTNEAGRFISDLAGKAIAMMGDRALTDTQRAQQFHDLFVASFDLPAIGQTVLGRHWNIANATQQAQFLSLFERQEVLVWAGRFKNFDGEVLSVESSAANANGGWQVNSLVARSGGQATPVEWTVAQSNSGWRVSDVAIKGVSMATTLRQDFGSVLQANGGKIDILIAAMQKMVDSLNAG